MAFPSEKKRRSSETQDLRRYLGNWRNGRGTVSERIAVALEEAIYRGEISAGSRLPSERQLAEWLDVSRSTIIRSLDLLEEHQSVERVQGSGTFVRDAGTLLPRGPGPRPLYDQFRVSDRTVQSLLAGVFPSARGLPERAFELTFEDIAGTSGPDATGSGYNIAGLARTRRVAADWIADEGGRPSPDTVIITTGATQSLALAFEVMVQPDDVVIVDPFAYPTAVSLLRARGARVLRAPADDDGRTDVQELYRRAVSSNAAMVVALPVCNSATGHSYSPQAMTALAHLAEHGVAVIEDRSLADFQPASTPPLAQLSTAPNVVTVGSFNKPYWGGLRLGWMSVHESLVASLVRVKSRMDSGASVPSQLILDRLLEDHTAIIEGRRSELAETRSLVARLITGAGAGWKIEGAPVGPTMWVRLPVGDSSAFVDYTSSHGISVAYGGDFRADGRGSPHIRLSLTSGSAVTRVSVEALLSLWVDHEAEVRSSPDTPS